MDMDHHSTTHIYLPLWATDSAVCRYLEEASDYMDVRACCSHKHADCQAGVHILQVHLGGMRSAKKEKITVNKAWQVDKGYDWHHTAIYSTLTYIWENLNKASTLMLRSNTFMIAPEISNWRDSRWDNVSSEEKSTWLHRVLII